MGKIKILSVLFVSILFIAGCAEIQPMRKGGTIFLKPTHGEYRIDHCLYYGRDCGKPAADNFCQQKGYAEAESWEWEPMSITWAIGEGNLCIGSFAKCGAFTKIKCKQADR